LISGTLFAFHKLPLVMYLAAILIFLNEVKGKSALTLSRDLGVQYKTAFVLAHKIREAMAAEIKGTMVGGDGRTAEIDGACTNQAESFFSRIRRAEIGHYHHISGPYLHRYAQEAAFREDHRRTSNGEQLSRVVSLVTRNRPSVDFCGYWQRSRAAA